MMNQSIHKHRLKAVPAQELWGPEPWCGGYNSLEQRYTFIFPKEGSPGEAVCPRDVPTS